MLKYLKSHEENESGFTLIELLAVVLIIGILAAIAIPVFLNQQKAAERASLKSDVRNTVDAVALTISQNPNDYDSQLTGLTSQATTPGYLFVKKSTDTRNFVLVEGSAAHYYVYGGVQSGGTGWYFDSKTGLLKDWNGTHYSY